VRAFGGALFLEGIEIPSHGRFRDAEFANEFIQRSKAADTYDVEKPAAAFVILHVLHSLRPGVWLLGDRKQANTSI
jgi:hypothetical protein